MLLGLALVQILTAQTIVVSGNKFTQNGKEIYINGVNAPWQWQSDCDINFMRKNFDWNYWNSELQKYADGKANVVRVWIHGSGSNSPALNGSGYVTPYPANDQFWKDMDALVTLAASKKIYLMPTFWSFDMAKDIHSNYAQFRQILTDDNKAGSYINNFLIPFVQRYANNQWIMGYDLCNEPEHVWRDANCGKLSEWWVTRFFARCAAAVHNNAPQPVTIGAMWAVYNSSTLGNGDGDQYAGYNRYSNTNIKNYYNDAKAYLDFYSPHWYQWQGSNGPFNRTVNQWIGADDKPVVTGETFGGDLSFISMANYYNYSYNNGFDGTMGWKNACQNDGYGTWNGVLSGLTAFYNAHSSLVYPFLSGTNIAYKKPVTATSSESTSYPVSNLVDANGSTRWSSAFTNEQFITIDLQSSYNITGVKLSWEAAYAKQYQIQVSSDNVTWTNVYANYQGSGATTLITLSSSARYVKLYAWERATTYGYSLYEIEVYGSLNSATKLKGDKVDRVAVNVYPNPSSSQITISGLVKADAIEVISLDGRVLASYNNIDAESLQIDVCGWPKGVYVVVVKGTDSVESVRFMVN